MSRQRTSQGRSVWKIGSILVLLLLVATACGSDDASENESSADGASSGAAGSEANDSEELISVTYAAPGGQPAPGASYYTSLPNILGYWQEEGLDVTVDHVAGSSLAVQLLESGEADFASAASQTWMSGVAQGGDFVAYYTGVTKQFQLPAVPADSDIETIADLAGTRVGVQSLESGTVLVIRALVESEGEDPDSIQFLPVGFGAEALAALNAGQIDAFGLWDDRYAEIESLGQPLRILSNDYADLLGFQTAFGAAPSLLAEQPDVAVGFARGIAKATLFASESPEEAVRLHWEAYPDSKPTGVDEDEALEAAVSALEARLENVQPVDGQWGYASTEQIDAVLQLLVEAEAVPSGLQRTDFWDDSLIEEINDFDADAVLEDAR